MVKCLVNFLMTQFSETDLCADVNEALATIIVSDLILDIRLLGIHQVGGDIVWLTRSISCFFYSS